MPHDLLDWADVAAIGIVASVYSDENIGWHIRRMLQVPRDDYAAAIAPALREAFEAGERSGRRPLSQKVVEPIVLEDTVCKYGVPW